MIYFVGRHHTDIRESLFRLLLMNYSMVKKNISVTPCNTEKSLRVALHGENS